MNNFLFAGTVPVYNFLFARTVPVYNFLFAGTVPVYNFLFNSKNLSKNLKNQKRKSKSEKSIKIFSKLKHGKYFKSTFLDNFQV